MSHVTSSVLCFAWFAWFYLDLLYSAWTKVSHVMPSLPCVALPYFAWFHIALLYSAWKKLSHVTPSVLGFAWFAWFYLALLYSAWKTMSHVALSVPGFNLLRFTLLGKRHFHCSRKAQEAAHLTTDYTKSRRVFMCFKHNVKSSLYFTNCCFVLIF